MGSLTVAVCALTGLIASTALAITPGVHAFNADLQDGPCRHAYCGSGELTGFGRVKTSVVLRLFAGRPKRCFTVVGTRRLTLANDRKSTLRLALKGKWCGRLIRGTFKVTSGSGLFAGATGSGVVTGSTTKTGREHVHFSGTLTLARK